MAGLRSSALIRRAASRQVLGVLVALLTIAATPSSAADGAAPLACSQRLKAMGGELLAEGSIQGRQVSLPTEPGCYPLLRLHVEITVSSAAGESILSAAYGGQTSLQAIITQSTEGSTSLDYVGQVDSRTQKMRPGKNDVVLENYLTDLARNIRNGAPSVTLETSAGRSPIGSVQVLPDSGLYSTTVSPEQLALGAPEQISANTDRHVLVNAKVRRRGERPDRPVVVRLESDDFPTLTRPLVRRAESVGRERTFNWRLPQAPAGTYHLRLSLEGHYNDGIAEVLVTVRKPPNLLPLFIGLGVLGMLLVLVPRRKRP